MTKQEKHNTIWSRMFDFFRILISFLVYSILIVGYLLCLVRYDGFLSSFRTTLLSSITVFLLTLFIPAILIVLINSYILGPVSDLLFTYFYIRIDLKTRIRFKDTFTLYKVFHPFSKEMVWFPFNEYANLPQDEKQDYLIYYAKKCKKEGNPMQPNLPDENL